ncbi:MAG: ATP-dependent Lon protease [Leptolyngbya sp.]|nr:MAG: ATP-dependent Lon protease [Leptolyngbya sp.]
MFMTEQIILDELDLKLAKAFPGRIVRKDLVKKLKVGFNIPVYVLEYLLGKYCSTTDETEIQRGLKQVKDAIAERVVRGDQSELIKARLQKLGSMKLIDLITVTFDEKVQGGKFWAKLATCGLDKVHIDDGIVHKHERLLTGGVWANLELLYDDSLTGEGMIRPFMVHRLAPIQIASANFEEYLEGRSRFTRDQWIDVLMRSMGYESSHPDFSLRRKLLYLLRLVPVVEPNYNLIELGPRGTGKSYVYREISPYVTLLSGGQGSIADLFGWKNRRDKPGLVLKFDLVAFDEVAGSNFKAESNKQMFKGYMEQGSFSRGDDKGTLSADAGIVFNGNLDGDVETTARISHLFNALPEAIRNDMAFHDRWHGYLPGWEMPKMQPDYFTTHMGFIADYIAEIFHTELRRRIYTDVYDQCFSLGSHVEERDRKAIARTTSGFIKLIHPDGNCSEQEMEEYLGLAIELRRRVKEQLKRMGGIEYSKVNLSYIHKKTGQETFVSCKELGSVQMIPDTPLSPGDLFTVGFDSNEGRYSLYRIQITAVPGNSRFSVVGTTGKGIKESARMAYDYLRSTAKKIGIDRDITAYDINIQVMSLMQGKDADDLGVAFYIGLISALLARAVAGGLVILGQMSIHGVLSRVEGLGDKLRVAMDAGAKRVMFPTENRRDFVDLPAEVIDKLQIDFYSDPAQAAFKALAET